MIVPANRQQAFRIACELKGVKQIDLAEAWNCSPTMVSLLVNGKSDSPRLRKRLDDFLASVDPAWVNLGHGDVQ